jgi:hypothetical protein
MKAPIDPCNEMFTVRSCCIYSRRPLRATSNNRIVFSELLVRVVLTVRRSARSCFVPMPYSRIPSRLSRINLASRCEMTSAL